MTTANRHRMCIEYLSSHHVLNLATCGSAGTWCAAVFYASEDLSLYFLSSPNSRHAADLDSNPRVACTIQEDYSDWRKIRGIQLEGSATQIRGQEQARAIALYGAKFPVIHAAALAPREIAAALLTVTWYRVLPSRVYFLDNSLGFGHRDIVFP
jgi:uncharacterized protein YhbP (UPF0306 family)